ncbi:MAG: hypothetical protein WBK91_05570 [Alphaproteobacteria bacterium]
MEWVADTVTPRSIHCVIKQDTRAGYYLFVWEDGLGIADDLQDDLETAMDVAFERFNVPKEAWRQVE